MVSWCCGQSAFVCKAAQPRGTPRAGLVPFSMPQNILQGVVALYRALYRKWRPRKFADVVGQEAIVTALQNQIAAGRIGHAYLFTGTRGTGKTTCAKIFAKAVNCLDTTSPDPCGECAVCKGIDEGTILDVSEIDAASNNSVDDIRDLRDETAYLPAVCKYKVYIIDEVHMLSTAAFNALLKTLEEPPAHVIFILATTESAKIPVTILSRCQRYDFHRISIDTIASRLSDLMEQEQVEVEERAIRYVAKAGDGSMRDALSLLDQCIAFYLGQTLTYDNVLEVLGTADTSVFSALLRNILNHDSIAALDIIDSMITEGRELSQLLSDFLWYLRNLLILKDQEGAEESLDMSKETIAALKEECSMVDTIALLRYIRLLSELSNQIRTATQKRVLLEVGFIKLCRPEMESDTESLSERIRQLEDKIAQGIPMIPANGPGNAGMITSKGTFAYDPYTGQPLGTSGAAGAGTAGMVNGTGNSAVSGAFPQGTEGQISPEEALEKRFSPAEADDLKEIASHWNDIVNQTSMPMQQFLRAARVAVADSSTILQLVFTNNDLAKEYFEREHHKNLDLLSELVAEQTGKVVTFECTSSTHQPTEQSNYIDLSKIHQTVIFE